MTIKKENDTMTTTNIKVTNISALTSAIDFLSASNFDAEVIAKLSAIRAQYEKQKNAPKKPTKTQTENETLKARMLDMFYDGKERTAADVKAEDATFYGLSVQKITALLSQLVEAHLIDRKEIKRKSYYALHIDEVIE